MKYAERPYLADVTDAQLADRLNYIIRNNCTLTPEGKIGCLTQKDEVCYWMERFTHVIEEFNRRGGIPEGIARKEIIPKPTWPIPHKSAGKSPSKPLVERQYFIRYGQKTHIQEMLQIGKIQLYPASGYKDTNLGIARSDDELNIEAISLKNEVTIKIQDKETGAWKPVSPTGNVTYKKSYNGDYYVFCMSTKYDPRLFDEFGESCLVIYDVDAFRDRILAAVQSQIGDWTDWDQPIRYFDPYVDRNFDGLFVPFTKHHRYWYQREYRFSWMQPETMKDPLKPVFITMGGLGDIAEMISCD